jgi:hypothetical protein
MIVAVAGLAADLAACLGQLKPSLVGSARAPAQVRRMPASV